MEAMGNEKLKVENAQLPDGWEMKTIADVARIISGGTPKTKIKEYWEGNIAWITPADLGKLKTREVSLTRRTITNEGLNKSSAKLFAENSVILSSRAPIGHLAINKIPMATNQGCRGLVPNDNLETVFLFYFLKSNVSLLNSLGTGATFKELSTKALGSVNIPLPPLTQQKQIVTILDKTFAAIDTAKANAAQNLQNAKELFESYLQNVFENKGDDWEEKTLGEVCGFFNGFAFKSKDSIDDSNTQVIRMGNLYQNKLSLDRKPAFYPDAFKTEYSKYLIKENDLIISLTGTTGKEDYGYTVKIPKTDRNLLLNQRIAKFIIKDENVISRNFLFRFLLSRTFLDELYKTANGTRQANLSTNTMKELFISFPPLKEQQKIVKKTRLFIGRVQKTRSHLHAKNSRFRRTKEISFAKSF